MQKPVAFIAILSFLLISGCNDNSGKKENTSQNEIYESIPTVCIWDKISARKEPFRKSPVISPINLGESVTYLGINAYDSAFKNQEYLKIRLSDGSIVWVPAFSLITNAKPAVVSNEVDIYLRPDLLTITDHKIAAMEIIAVLVEQDGWINFISEKKNASGWIQDDKVNFNKEEIAFALMAKRILTENNDKSLLSKIDSVLSNNPYQNSIFIPLLREIRKQEEEKQQIENMMQQNFNSF